MRPNLAEMIWPGPISGPCNYIKGNMTVTIVQWTARTNFMQTGTLGHSNNLSGATDRLTIKIYKWFWRILNFSLDRVWAGVVFVRLIYVIMHRFSLTKKKNQSITLLWLATILNFSIYSLFFLHVLLIQRQILNIQIL